ncbi:MAG TPA: magnesium transporter, partial [Anaerolineae bacterium]
KNYYPPDLAHVLAFLTDDQDRAIFDLLEIPEAAEVLDEADERRTQLLARSAEPERMAQILKQLPSDKATDILQTLELKDQSHILELLDGVEADEIRKLIPYPKESAGGIMSLGFVTVPDTATIGQALQAVRAKLTAEPPTGVYVLDDDGWLKGELRVGDVIRQKQSSPVTEFMLFPVISVPPELDRERVARIFAHYDLSALAVTDSSSGKLIGVITADHVIDVIEQENTEDMLRMAGSDAEEMERRTPLQIALLRLPWIMATMLIELGAGAVIHFYDATLARVLLLASFMPIISAISGNTGLQSATIIVRGLASGQVHLTEWRRALMRQLTMTLFLGTATGLTLGTIGAIWYGKVTFGFVVAVGMFAAVNIAGVVGTVVPLVSKRLGFDPAITSGPFETAFQDVVGISIFLSLATFLIHYLL